MINTHAKTLGKKGRSRSEEKRERILQAAADLFTGHGFTHTSMDQIAERAGVSKQTVYSHFGDKEGVFVAAIKQRCILASLVPELEDASNRMEDQLLDIARQFSQLLLSEESIKMTRLCMTEAEQHPEVSQLFYDAGPQLLTDTLVNYLQQQVERGRLAIGNCRFAAWQFLFMVDADAAFRARLGLPQAVSEEARDSYLQDCVAVFLRAYRAGK